MSAQEDFALACRAKKVDRAISIFNERGDEIDVNEAFMTCVCDLGFVEVMGTLMRDPRFSPSYVNRFGESHFQVACEGEDDSFKAVSALLKDPRTPVWEIFDLYGSGVQRACLKGSVKVVSSFFNEGRIDKNLLHEHISYALPESPMITFLGLLGSRGFDPLHAAFDHGRLFVQLFCHYAEWYEVCLLLLFFPSLLVDDVFQGPHIPVNFSPDDLERIKEGTSSACIMVAAAGEGNVAAMMCLIASGFYKETAITAPFPGVLESRLHFNWGVGEEESDILAMILFVADEYFRVKTLANPSVVESRAVRFFSMANRLHFDLQVMLVSVSAPLGMKSCLGKPLRSSVIHLCQCLEEEDKK